MSFIKGTSYSGNQGNVCVKQEDPEAPISTLYGSIIALDKGIILNQNDDIITFIFNENIIKIEYKTYKKSMYDKIINLI